MILLRPAATLAQSNFHKFGVGAGYGITRSFADVYDSKMSTAGYLAADFHLTPYIDIGMEYQQGEIGKDYTNSPGVNKAFKNEYQALIFHSKAQLGAIVDYQRSGFLNAIRGIYVGTGIGLINNNRKEAFLPLNLGLNIYFPDQASTNRLVFNINYQTNIIFGEGFGRYDSATKVFKRGMPDVYLFLNAGLRYNFGTIGLSKKPFRKY